MVEWGKAPWTLRLYVAIALAESIVVAVVAPSTPVAPRLFFVVFTAVVCFFLLRAVRWLWLLTIAFIFVGFTLEVVENNLRWYGVAQGIVALLLLLHPTTQRFFRQSSRKLWCNSSSVPSGGL